MVKIIDLNKPGVATELLRIHSIITRAIKISIEEVTAYHVIGFKSSNEKQGFSDYLSCLMTSLHAHHLSEDRVIFPKYLGKMSDTPFEMLGLQHKAMMPMIEDIKKSALEISQSEPNDLLMDSRMAALKRQLITVSKMWFPHIKVEEENFTYDKMEEISDKEEQSRILKAASEESQKNSGPPDILLAFLIYNQPKELRESFTKNIPQDIVKKVHEEPWMSKWKLMKPFMLD